MNEMSIEQMKAAGYSGDQIVTLVVDRLNDGLEYAVFGSSVLIDVEDLRLMMRYVKVMETFIQTIQDGLDKEEG